MSCKTDINCPVQYIQKGTYGPTQKPFNDFDDLGGHQGDVYITEEAVKNACNQADNCSGYLKFYPQGQPYKDIAGGVGKCQDDNVMLYMPLYTDPKSWESHSIPCEYTPGYEKVTNSCIDNKCQLPCKTQEDCSILGSQYNCSKKGLCSDSLECMNNDGCPAEKRYCDDNNKCSTLDCKTQEDCSILGSTYKCSKRGICSNSLECILDSSCVKSKGITYICDQNNKCIDHPQCKQSSDCKDMYMCESGMCVYTGCTNDEDCPKDSKCGKSGKCSDSLECQTDTDCSTGDYCNNDNKCIFVPECQTNNDCLSYSSKHICLDNKCSVPSVLPSSIKYIFFIAVIIILLLVLWKIYKMRAKV